MVTSNVCILATHEKIPLICIGGSIDGSYQTIWLTGVGKVEPRPKTSTTSSSPTSKPSSSDNPDSPSSSDCKYLLVILIFTRILMALLSCLSNPYRRTQEEFRCLKGWCRCWSSCRCACIRCHHRRWHFVLQTTKTATGGGGIQTNSCSPKLR